MARQSTVVLECDGPECGARRQGKPGVSAEDLRALLVRVGWRVTEDRRGIVVDLCPTCVARGVVVV
jgi:hypothetical protein